MKGYKRSLYKRFMSSYILRFTIRMIYHVLLNVKIFLKLFSYLGDLLYIPKVIMKINIIRIRFSILYIFYTALLSTLKIISLHEYSLQKYYILRSNVCTKNDVLISICFSIHITSLSNHIFQTSYIWTEEHIRSENMKSPIIQDYLTKKKLVL